MDVGREMACLFAGPSRCLEDYVFDQTSVEERISIVDQ